MNKYRNILFESPRPFIIIQLENDRLIINETNIDTKNDFTVFDISTPYKIDPESFLTKGRATPFAGKEVYGRCVLTVCDSKTVYEEK